MYIKNRQYSYSPRDRLSIEIEVFARVLRLERENGLQHALDANRDGMARVRPAHVCANARVSTWSPRTAVKDGTRLSGATPGTSRSP